MSEKAGQGQLYYHLVRLTPRGCWISITEDTGGREILQEWKRAVECICLFPWLTWKHFQFNEEEDE